MKVIFNYATRQFEPMEPSMRERFALGGRVNFDKGSPFLITDEVLEQIDNLIKDTNLNLKEIGQQIGYGTEKSSMTINTPVMERYIEKYGRPSDARLQTRGVPLSPEKGIGKKIVKAYDKQIKNFGKANISQIVRDVYGPGVKDFDSARAQVRSVLGDFRNYKGKANVPIDKKDLTTEQIKSKARAKKLKLVDNPTISKFMAGPKGSGFQYHHMDATKTSPVTLNNVVYLPDEVNNYIQSYEGPISKRKKEITKLNKNKPKGYKKQIDAKLNQIRNTIAKADMDLDKAGYSAYKGVIEVDTIDVNGKSIKIGGGSALRLGEGLAEELGLDSNKPLKEFSSEEKIKLTEAKKALIKKSSINKPKATGLAKKGLKMGLKQLPLVGSAIGLYDMGKAVQAGVRNPLDLYAAYEVSPEVALKSKAMREDKTGKLLAEEISKLPDIGQELPDSDEVAGLLEESGSPYMQFLQGGGQLSPEEFNQLQSIPQSDRPLTGELDLPEMDQTMMAAQGGRVGFANGSPDPMEEKATLNQAIAALQSPELKNQFLYDTSSVGKLEKNVLGKDGDRTLMQQFNTQFLDPRSYPYYAQKLARGAANIPEFILSTPKAGLVFIRDLKKNMGITKESVAEIMDILDPEITRDFLNGEYGDLLGISDKAIQASEEKRSGPQRTTGEFLQFVGELPGPATPFFLIGYAPKLLKQLKSVGVTAAGIEKVNKEIENKVAQQGVDQTRRDIVLSIGAGAGVGFLKYLGLDFLSKAPKVVAKQVPEIVTKGGTPKYFFDFVNLIKTKGDDITETASTLERQKVYDYNGYTMYEDISTGKISINKDTEGGASYYIGDGEYDTVDGIIRKEEIVYDPPETVLDDAGKPKKVPDYYEESTMKPDYDGGDGDVEGGLDSIDDILDLLAKSGEKYNLKELKEMGINPEGLGRDFLRKILRNTEEIKLLDSEKAFKDTMNKVKYKIEKAGGGIIKLAGDDSGPPPKSGPTPHGLPYIAKNVRPIKERK